MKNVIKLVKSHGNKEQALRTLDDLRAQIENGSVIAFAAVGIHPDDNTSRWTDCIDPVSKLRMIGAMHHLLHCYEQDDEA